MASHWSMVRFGDLEETRSLDTADWCEVSFYLNGDQMEQEHYILNIENCIADRTRPAVIRTLFMDIRERGYVTVGEFFKNINDADLDTLRDISETIMDLEGGEPQTLQEQDAYSNIVLLSCALLVAEGSEVDPAIFSTAVKVTMSFIALEALARMNMIDVYRENWSMDPESSAILAQAKK